MSGEVINMNKEQKPIVLRDVYELMEDIFEAVCAMQKEFREFKEENQRVEITGQPDLKIELPKTSPNNHKRGYQNATLQLFERMKSIMRDGRTWHYIQVHEALLKMGDDLAVNSVSRYLLDLSRAGEIQCVQSGMYKLKEAV